MNKTKIEWCDSTWNPVTGCYNNCEYCYARNIAHRFSSGGEKWCENGDIHILDERFCGTDEEDDKANPYPYGFQPTLHRYRLNDYKDKKGRNIFVCSMADLFGDWVADCWIKEVFDACATSPQHNYLFLTKNPDRYVDLILKEALPEEQNMWYGVTVTNKREALTAEATMQDMSDIAGAYLSIEPLLEDITKDIELTLANFTDWVIIGAETGRRKEKIIPQREWIENIVSICKEYNVPVFMKDSLRKVWGKELLREQPQRLQNDNHKRKN